MVKTKKMTRAIGLLMGVIPQFQRKGIESAFILHLEKVFKQIPHYTELEFSWVGDFNPPMRKLWLAVGAKPAKHYITYRYLFDRNAKFKRYPIPE
jgi:GNAT superfamily N-acetyltransferase